MENDKEKSFKCEICYSHFKQKRSLKSHILSVHEEKELFICEICGKTFQYKTSLTGHIAAAHLNVIFVIIAVRKRVTWKLMLHKFM